MDVALWEALPLAERAKIEAEKKAEEEKRTAQQAFWEIYVASERVKQLVLWQKARARAVRVADRDGNGYPLPTYPAGKNPIRVRVWDKKYPWIFSAKC